MKVHREQLHVQEAPLRQQREQRLALHLRERHPRLVAALSDAELSRRVRLGVARAGAYGVTWDSTLAAYLLCMLRAAPNFDEHASIRAVLTNEDLEPNLRMKALIDETTAEDWAEVVAARDESAWSDR